MERILVNVTKDAAMIGTSVYCRRSAYALLWVVTVALQMAFPVRPASAADPFNGERLAQRWCSACHVVASTQREANADAPPFEEIAKRPTFTENGLTVFLLNPHAKMPDMNLSRIEAGDIAAFVARLK
jgi:mono/diheme cytochrome c family protein